MNNNSIEDLEAQQKYMLRTLRRIGPTIDGSLTSVKRVCGKPNCRCARGEKHVAWQLTRKVAGRSEAFYIPVDQVEQVQEWVREHRNVKETLNELGRIGRELIRAGSERKRVLRKTANSLKKLP